MARAALYILYILLYIGAALTTALSPGGEAGLQFSPSGVRVVEQHVVPDTGLPGLTVWTFTQVPVGGLLAASPLSCTVK